MSNDFILLGGSDDDKDKEKVNESVHETEDNQGAINAEDVASDSQKDTTYHYSFREKEPKNYDYYKVTSEDEDSHKKFRFPKKEKGTGRKFGTLITAGLIFGLVAGVTFQGVNRLGNMLFPEKKVESSDQKVEMTQTLPDTGSSSVANGLTSSAPSGATVSTVAHNAMPSVVAITAVSVQEVQDWFGRSQSYEGVGSGSGIIVGENDEELLIATNNHVVADAQSLSVCFIGDDAKQISEEETSGVEPTSAEDDVDTDNAVSALIKGTDPENDLAVIAVKKEEIPEETMSQIKIAQIGDSDSLLVGEQVVAIGNALGYGQSVTSGYVSALNRQVDMENMSSSLIQTDAAINPGNSGGALLNMKGELIGINSAKLADSTIEGMGYAIPISYAQPILDDLMSRETRTKVDEKDASYIGISGLDVREDYAQMYGAPTGVFVGSVEEDGPAAKAGIQEGDIITSFGKVKIGSMNDLTEQLSYYSAGETVEVAFQRTDEGKYQEKTVEVTLGAKKDMKK